MQMRCKVMNLNNNINLYKEIKQVVLLARKNIIKNVNVIMVTAYFNIGKLIIESEQKGQKRAEYAKEIIKELSNKLFLEFGKGFSETNLKQMRKFYVTYKNCQTLSD